MTLRVEFYGIPRQRAGVATASAEGSRLGDILASLEAQFPELATDCISDHGLRSGCVANINGDRFVTDPNTQLHDGDVVLLLSADAGG